MASTRIMKELAVFMNGSNEDIVISPASESNIFTWRGYIVGPKGTPYEGGHFKVTVEFPTDYPFKPPAIFFNTKVYHPNVNQDGKICLEILSKDWNPSVSISVVLNTVLMLLKEPTVEDSVQPSISAQLKDDPEEFEKVAREWTNNYAKPESV